MGSPSKPLCQQGETCHDQRVGLHRLRQEKQKRQQVPLPKPFNGFSGCSAVFICLFQCCWAVRIFLRLNPSLVHLSLLFQRLGRFLSLILTSPSALPLPTAHSFLYYKHKAFLRVSKAQVRKTRLSLPVFFQELIDLPSPIVSVRNENHFIK